METGLRIMWPPLRAEVVRTGKDTLPLYTQPAKREEEKCQSSLGRKHFWGDSFRRLRGKRRSAMRGSAYRKHTIYAFKEPYMWHINIILARCNVRTLQICPKCVPEILHLL